MSDKSPRYVPGIVCGGHETGLLIVCPEGWWRFLRSKLLPDAPSEAESELTCPWAGGVIGSLMRDGEAIFLRSGKNLTVMRETPYQTEAVLQDALTQFPEV